MVSRALQSRRILPAMLGPRRAGVFARLLAPAHVVDRMPIRACELHCTVRILQIRDLQALAVANPNQAADAHAGDVAPVPPRAMRRRWMLPGCTLCAPMLTAPSSSTADARAAAAEGMKLVSDLREPVRLALFFIDSENIYDAEGIAEAKRTRRSRARRGRRDRKPNAACCSRSVPCSSVRIAPTSLSLTLTQAYRASAAAGNLKQRSWRRRCCPR